jgi:hypothetical protein
MSWNFDLGYQNQIYNWYGLPESFKYFNPADRSTLVNGIDPQHSYNTLSAGTKIEFNDGFLKKL